jgi:hypothetical protein
MRCEQLGELTIDYLKDGLDAPTRREIDEHLAGCPACRREMDELGAVWTSLGRLPAPPPHADLAARFRRSLGSADRTVVPLARPVARRRGPLVQAVAAGIILAVGLLAGAALQRAASHPSEPAQVADGRRDFMLLLHETPSTSSVTPEEERRLVEEYSAWARGLAAAGDLVGGEKLAAEYRTVVGGTSGAMTAAGVIGGYFLVKARSYDEAVEIARTCPHLAHGGSIEVRMVEPT